MEDTWIPIKRLKELHNDPSVNSFLDDIISKEEECKTPGLAVARIYMTRVDIHAFQFTGRTKEDQIGQGVVLYRTDEGSLTKILGIGRDDYCVFKPTYANGSLDRSVSRQHGWVYLLESEGKVQVRYRDVGTLQQGSSNGSMINDRKRIDNKAVALKDGDFIGIGQRLAYSETKSAGSVFKIRVQRV